MKTDAYTKGVLTVIAACLTVLVLQNADLIPNVKASKSSSPNQEMVKVPVNEDGTIDVRLKEGFQDKIMDVNIVRVSGNDARKGIPIKPYEHSMNVNIEEVGGYQVYGDVPVKMK